MSLAKSLKPTSGLPRVRPDVFSDEYAAVCDRRFLRSAGPSIENSRSLFSSLQGKARAD
jgi:hypothetical protein